MLSLKKICRIFREGKDCHGSKDAMCHMIVIAWRGWKKGAVEGSLGKGRVEMHIDKLPVILVFFKIGMASLYNDSLQFAEDTP